MSFLLTACRTGNGHSVGTISSTSIFANCSILHTATHTGMVMGQVHGYLFFAGNYILSKDCRRESAGY